MWLPGTKMLAWCLALLATGGCAGNSKATSESQVGLSDSEWVLESHGLLGDSAPVPDGIEITFRMDNEQQTISGYSGCNTYTSSCTVKGKSIRLASLSGTKRACPDQPEVMKLEQQFLAALASITRYEITDGVLTLYAREGQGLLFRQSNP